MQEYDHIMDRFSNMVAMLHDTFKIGIKFAAFATNHLKDYGKFEII